MGWYGRADIGGGWARHVYDPLPQAIAHGTDGWAVQPRSREYLSNAGCWQPGGVRRYLLAAPGLRARRDRRAGADLSHRRARPARHAGLAADRGRANRWRPSADLAGQPW